MKYYIIRDAKPFGPLDKQDLRAYGVNADSDIWHEGLPQWVKAGTIPGLADVWSASDHVASMPEESILYNAPAPPHPYSEPECVPHTNWLPWAVTATVLGFLFSCIGMIFGIVGIVQANKANNYYAFGSKVAGDSANSTAKTMTIICFCIAGIGLIYSIVMIATGRFAAMMELMESM